jgi:hypothetical protein
MGGRARAVAAAQEVVELACDEARERAISGGGVGEQRRQVRGPPVQESLLGIAGSVRQRRTRVRMRHARYFSASSPP